MLTFGREIYRAIHEGRWLAIEYRNFHGEVTRYWVGVKDIDPLARRMSVRGMHLATHEVRDLTRISIESILSCEVVDGTYFEVPDRLLVIGGPHLACVR